MLPVYVGSVKDWSDQSKIERLVKFDARLILRRKLNGATTRKSPNWKPNCNRGQLFRPCQVSSARCSKLSFASLCTYQCQAGGGWGKRGIGRDFDWSLWPGGGAFELSCCPGGRDIWIFVRARDHKSFPLMGSCPGWEIQLYLTSQFWQKFFGKCQNPAHMPHLPPRRLDIDRYIMFNCSVFWGS